MLRVCLSVCICNILMNLRFQQFAVIFFHVQYLSELHCSQKYYKGINSNLFIKNYINYTPICTFNVCKSCNVYIKREIAGDTYLFVHIYLYRFLPLLFQKWLYRGKNIIFKSRVFLQTYL